MSDQYSELVTAEEAAAILYCGTANVRYLVQAGQLPVAVVVGLGHGQRLFRRSDVEALALDRAERWPWRYGKVRRARRSA